MDQYQIQCECGGITATLHGTPKVTGHCHCEDCRTLLNTPYHSVTAWPKEQFELSSGAELIKEQQHPQLRMKRGFCQNCGETVYNTNGMDWRVVSQHLVRKCYNGKLPEALEPKMHFFYGRRIVDIDDALPKRE